jgi:cob(I)alamin adenosyltransferase
VPWSVMVRIDRVTTRTGDDGTTALADGSRVGKDDALIAAIGSVDEANSVLGLVRLEPGLGTMAADLDRIQNDLFDLGADLATPFPGAAGQLRVPAAHVERLDALVRATVAPLPPLTSFILPGGTRAAVLFHLARTVVRRAEREVVRAGRSRTLNPEVLRYLNRLSDLCFVWARASGGDGRTWVPAGGG